MSTTNDASQAADDLHMEMPDASKASKAILKRVKSAVTAEKSLEQGVKVWEESLKNAVDSGAEPEQTMVDHWRALEYLHRTQFQVQQQVANEQKGRPVDETLKALELSTSLAKYSAIRPPSPSPPQVRASPNASSSATENGSSAKSASSPATSPRKAKKNAPAATSTTAAATAASPSTSQSTAKSSTSSSATPAPASGGKVPVVQQLSKLTFAKGDPYEKIVEMNGTPVKHLQPKTEFNNWGGTVKNVPAITFEPKTRTGICNIVKWAVAQGKRVRAAGYRHTWSSIYGEDEGVLIAMIPTALALGKSYTPLPEATDDEDDLEGVEFLREENGVGYARIGAATTNDQFRVWALQHGWTIPMSVDLVEISFGGATSPMAHGTGLAHPTMADLITELEFVNANGDVQRVTSENQLKAAAGALGVMGIVVSMVMKLEKMTYASMKPYKIDAMLAVPPPPESWTEDGQPWKVPKQLQTGASRAQLKGAQKVFESQVAHDFYNEYFWFPFQQKAFVNCWHNDGEKEKSKTMSNCEALAQDIQGTLGSMVNVGLGLVPGSGKFMTKFITWSAMQVLPDMSAKREPEVTPVIEAFYFRRGLHNMPMWDMEMTIPIPGRKDKPHKPDWCIINRAWWDCINMVYEYAARDEYPVRLGLAMHIISDSNMFLAPEYGNKVSTGKHKTFGSLTINISTVPQTPRDLWERFSRELAIKWQSYTFADGSPLNVRAHWVKQWEFLTAPDGTPLPEHYRKVSYKHQIPEFLAQLKKIAAAGGHRVKNMRRTFSNPLLDSILWHDKTK